mgnify:CR=1 FL=1
MSLTKCHQIEVWEKTDIQIILKSALSDKLLVLEFLSCLLGAKNARHDRQQSNRQLFQIFGTEIITDIEKEAEGELGTLASMEKRMVGEEVTIFLAELRFVVQIRPGQPGLQIRFRPSSNTAFGSVPRS